MSADGSGTAGYNSSGYGFALLSALGMGVWGAILGLLVGEGLQLILHAAGVTPSYANSTDWPPIIAGLIGVGIGLAFGWLGARGYHKRHAPGATRSHIRRVRDRP